MYSKYKSQKVPDLDPREALASSACGLCENDHRYRRARPSGRTQPNLSSPTTKLEWAALFSSHTSLTEPEPIAEISRALRDMVHLRRNIPCQSILFPPVVSLHMMDDRLYLPPLGFVGHD